MKIIFEAKNSLKRFLGQARKTAERIPENLEEFFPDHPDPPTLAFSGGGGGGDFLVLFFFSSLCGFPCFSKLTEKTAEKRLEIDSLGETCSTSRIFLVFFLLGEGEGGVRGAGPGGGGGTVGFFFFMKSQKGGGSRRGRRRGGRTMSAANWGIFSSWGGASFGDGYPADIRGSFARMSRPKTWVRVLKIREKQAFGRGHP